jgi:hypothetical protein
MRHQKPDANVQPSEKSRAINLFDNVSFLPFSRHGQCWHARGKRGHNGQKGRASRELLFDYVLSQTLHKGDDLALFRFGHFKFL